MDNSSLRVDQNLVDDLFGMQGVFDVIKGGDIEARKALIRYTALIHSRRQLLEPSSKLDALSLQLLSDIDRIIVDNIFHPEFIHGSMRVGSFGTEVLSLMPVLMHISSTQDDQVVDVPASRVVTGAWNPSTIALMMSIEDDELRAKLPQELPDMVQLKGTDIYFVQIGNHRVLAQQFLGDESIKANLKVLELDPSKFELTNKGSIMVGGSFDTQIPLPKSAQLILLEMGVKAPSLQIGN